MRERVSDNASQISELIARTALRDRRAFSRLYDLTSSKLFAVCLRILRDRVEAEDALQDIYVKIWKNSGRFVERDRTPFAWLTAIARNHAIDVVRARPPMAQDIDTIIDLPDSGRNPEALAIVKSEGARIEKCMKELATERAAAIRAAYVEGYSYDELARRFGIPLNTMRTWLRRGLISLRQCLEDGAR